MNTRQGGFSYLFMLFMVAMGGIMLVASTQTAWMEAKRDKEAELLFAGDEIRKAINAYFRATPTPIAPANQGVAGAVGQYPLQLEDLLSDHRFTPPLRHLRRIYIEPMTAGREWGLIREGGRITGVYSRSPDKPLKTAKFPAGYESFALAASYADWKFALGQQATAKPGGPGASPIEATSETVPPPLVPQPQASLEPESSLPELPVRRGAATNPPPQQSESQQENSSRTLQCVIAYGKAMRECRMTGNQACMTAAMANRDACIAGG